MDYRKLRNLLHPFIEIQWAGMRSTVDHMSRQGWEFEMIRHEEFQDCQLVFRNINHDAVGYCRKVDQYRIMDMHMSSYDRPNPSLMVGGPANISFDATMHKRIETQLPMDYSIHKMSVGIMRPDGEVYIIESHKDDAPEELIIMPEDIPDLMAKIRKVQEPRAREILANQRKRQELSELNTKATILSFNKVS